MPENRWIVRLRKGLVDRMWEELVMAAIGERLLEDQEDQYASDDVCGCVVSVRKDEDLLSVWHRDGRSAVKKERLE
jgi:translation initiation factor 4E